MDNEKIIEELLERIQILEANYDKLLKMLVEQESTVVSQFCCYEDGGTCKCEFKPENPTQTEKIIEYILDIFNEALDNDYDNVVLTSGDLHKALKLKQRVPSVCKAMRKVGTMKYIVDKYEVIKDTPSHNSSTYTIKYYLKRG